MLTGPRRECVYGITQKCVSLAFIAPSFYLFNYIYLFFRLTASYITLLLWLFTTEQNQVAYRDYILSEERERERGVIKEGSLSTVFYSQRLTRCSSRRPPPPPPLRLKRLQPTHRRVKKLLTKSKRALISIWREARQRLGPLEWSRCQLGNMAEAITLRGHHSYSRGLSAYTHTHTGL